MQVFKITCLAMTGILTMPAAAESQGDWRLAAGIRAGGRDIPVRVHVSDAESSSVFFLDAGAATGAEVSLARNLWGNWRVAGHYAYLSGNESDRWGVTFEGEPHSVSASFDSREQQLGVEMLRLFRWGDNWIPFLGLGLGYSRFESDLRSRLESVDGIQEQFSVRGKPRNDWFYAGVAGIEYRFAEYWSAEVEWQRIGHLDSDKSSSMGDNLALRLAYRF